MFWLFVLLYSLIFAFACYYLANEKNKDPMTWAFIGFFLGIIGILILGFSEKNETVVSTDDVFTEFETDGNHKFDEKLVKRLKELKLERPNWTIIQLTKELKNEGYDVESEEQISYLLKYPIEKVNDVSSLNRNFTFDELLAKRAKELKDERPVWNISQLTKELEKEGYEIESEEQVSYLLRYPIEKVNNASRTKGRLTKKDQSQDLSIDIYANIEKLGGLLDKGYISQEEFNEKKRKLLDQL